MCCSCLNLALINIVVVSIINQFRFLGCVIDRRTRNSKDDHGERIYVKI